MRTLSKIILIFLMITVVGQVNARADSDKVGTTTANFLKIEAGGRPVGMGGAFVAVCDDVNALYWNPAGLVQLKDREFIAVHTFWLEQISHDYLACAIPLKDKFAYGVQIIYLGTGDIDRRTATGISDGKASVADYSVGGSLAWKLKENISIGLTIKGIQMNLDKNKGSGFAADIALLDKVIDNLSIGFMLQNFGQRISAVNTSEDLPTNIKTGLAYRMPGNKLLLAGDIDIPNDQAMRFHLGGEYQLDPTFALRLGFEDTGTQGNSSGMTAGISVSEDSVEELLNVKMKLDYAWLYLGELGSTHHIALSLKF
jgi:long-subunit fatty acid transport protein